MELHKSLSAKIFKYGWYVPKSVAIITDGNRRYAGKNKFEKIKVHGDGLKKLLEVVDWSLYFEIKEVTAFAFSIDNFDRPKEEDKFTYSTEKEEYFDSKKIRVCFYGNLSISQDKDLVDKFRKIEEETKNNQVLKLNICFSYNSSEEIIRAMEILENKINIEKEKNDKNNSSINILINNTGHEKNYKSKKNQKSKILLMMIIATKEIYLPPIKI